jgi:hypothetical protein
MKQLNSRSLFARINSFPQNLSGSRISFTQHTYKSIVDSVNEESLTLVYSDSEIPLQMCLSGRDIRNELAMIIPSQILNTLVRKTSR